MPSEFIELNSDNRFSILERKHPFRTNLVKKLKLVCLSKNLIPRLIRICAIR